MEHTIQSKCTKLFKRANSYSKSYHVGGYTHVDPVGIVVSGSLSVPSAGGW